MALQILPEDRTREQQSEGVGGSLGQLLGGLVSRKMEQNRSSEAMQSLYGVTPQQGQVFAQAPKETQQAYLKQQNQLKLQQQKDGQQKEERLQARQAKYNHAVKRGMSQEEAMEISGYDNNMYRDALADFVKKRETEQLANYLKKTGQSSTAKDLKEGLIDSKEASKKRDQIIQSQNFYDKNEKALSNLGFSREDASNYSVSALQSFIKDGAQKQDRTEKNLQKIQADQAEISKIAAQKKLNPGIDIDQSKEFVKAVRSGKIKTGQAANPISRFFSNFLKEGNYRGALNGARKFLSTDNPYLKDNYVNSVDDKDGFASVFEKALEWEEIKKKRFDAQEEVAIDYADSIENGDMSLDQYNRLVYDRLRGDQIQNNPQANPEKTREYRTSQNAYDTYNKNQTPSQSQLNEFASKNNNDQIYYSNNSSFVDYRTQEPVGYLDKIDDKMSDSKIVQEIKKTLHKNKDITMPVGNYTLPADKKQMRIKNAVDTLEATEKKESGIFPSAQSAFNFIKDFTTQKISDLISYVSNTREMETFLENAEMTKKNIDGEPLTEQQKQNLQKHYKDMYLASEGNAWDILGCTDRLSEEEFSKIIGDEALINRHPEIEALSRTGIELVRAGGSAVAGAGQMASLGLDLATMAHLRGSGFGSTENVLSNVFTLGNYDKYQDAVNGFIDKTADYLGLNDKNEPAYQDLKFYSSLAGQSVGQSYAMGGVLGLAGKGISNISDLNKVRQLLPGMSATAYRWGQRMLPLAKSIQNTNHLREGGFRGLGTFAIEKGMGVDKEEAQRKYDLYSLGFMVASPFVPYIANRFATNNLWKECTDMKSGSYQAVNHYLNDMFHVNFSAKRGQGMFFQAMDIPYNTKKIIGEKVTDLYMKNKLDAHSFFGYVLPLCKKSMSPSNFEFFKRNALQQMHAHFPPELAKKTSGVFNESINASYIKDSLSIMKDGLYKVKDSSNSAFSTFKNVAKQLFASGNQAFSPDKAWLFKLLQENGGDNMIRQISQMYKMGGMGAVNSLASDPKFVSDLAKFEKQYKQEMKRRQQKKER